ncbi:radical SAM superfamily protein [Bacteroides eggerthii 1_2_48FAA]|uniref:Radical SAM superfamily protein n=1 Tax=Bacteroides eggerthii 1_2_48FAA TaxID=665953 RepID=E5WTR1_9BACE|nr:radical SAM superfamily protein [Bacteroides eggerthii 1_2_48FAA]
MERWKIWKRREEAPFCGVDRHRMGTDGNGITTLVVFHDCPLRCKYCLNPQTLGPRYEDAVYYIPKELYQEVKKDNLYFLSTHGGITFGGGEPCLYSRFICKFRLQCGPSWRLTVETSLNVPQGDLESLLDVVDYYIVDIKDMDASKYRQYTGEDNCRVIDNLRFLLEHGKSDSILVRVPLIPHYNTTTDVENNVRILKDMGVSHFDRLTYQVQEEVGGKLTKLTGKLQDYESRKKGWLERLERAVFDIE